MYLLNFQNKNLKNHPFKRNRSLGVLGLDGANWSSKAITQSMCPCKIKKINFQTISVCDKL